MTIFKLHWISSVSVNDFPGERNSDVCRVFLLRINFFSRVVLVRNEDLKLQRIFVTNSAFLSRHRRIFLQKVILLVFKGRKSNEPAEIGSEITEHLWSKFAEMIEKKQTRAKVTFPPNWPLFPPFLLYFAHFSYFLFLWANLTKNQDAQGCI